MIEVLEPLGRIPGVRIAILVTPDGVPVVVRGQGGPEGEEGALCEENVDSLAALASGWLQGVCRSVAPLSWNPPQRAVLRAARGTLVMLEAPGALLAVVLDRGTSPEDLRLPMGAAVVRMQRVLRREDRGAPAPGPAEAEPESQPRAPLPTGSGKGLEPVRADSRPVQSPRESPG